jgi:hypothetical protein
MRLAILVFSVAAFAFSLAMVRGLVGVASPWFGLLLMMCVLGTAAMARPLFLPRMPPPLRRIRAWERQPGNYRRLLVPAFGSLLRRSPLRYLNSDVYLASRTRDAGAVRAQVEAAEAAHLWAGLVLLPYVVHAALERRWGAAAALAAVEVAANLYPILHLRWTRLRLDGALGRRQQKGRPQPPPVETRPA